MTTSSVARRLPVLAKLGHVALRTPDIEQSTRFFTDVIGLDEVDRSDEAVYLRAWGEFDHHSVVLIEGDAAIDHIGWRAAHPDVLDELSRDLMAGGVTVLEVGPDEELGQGRAIRFITPVGRQPFEVYWDMTRPMAPLEIRSRMRSNSSTPNRRGISPRRIDHVNVRVQSAADAESWLQSRLGFATREMIKRTGEPLAAAWLAVTSQVHDLAVVDGEEGRFHHVGFLVEDFSALSRAAHLLRDEGIDIDLGPGMHGVTQANFLYVRDPGSGHRVEVFQGGYHVFDPDWEPIVWDEASALEARYWWGADAESVGRTNHPMSVTTSSVPPWALAGAS